MFNSFLAAVQSYGLVIDENTCGMQLLVYQYARKEYYYFNHNFIIAKNVFHTKYSYFYKLKEVELISQTVGGSSRLCILKSDQSTLDY